MSLLRSLLTSERLLEVFPKSWDLCSFDPDRANVGRVGTGSGPSTQQSLREEEGPPKVLELSSILAPAACQDVLRPQTPVSLHQEEAGRTSREPMKEEGRLLCWAKQNVTSLGNHGMVGLAQLKPPGASALLKRLGVWETSSEAHNPDRLEGETTSGFPTYGAENHLGCSVLSKMSGCKMSSYLFPFLTHLQVPETPARTGTESDSDSI